MATWRQEARAAGWAPPKARREPRVVETPEYVQMVRRVLARLGERVGDDPATLPALVELRDAVNAALTAAIAAARNAEPPYSWADIGREMGVSRQAAQQLYERHARGGAEL